MWAGEGCEEVSGYIEGFLARELREDGVEAPGADTSAKESGAGAGAEADAVKEPQPDVSADTEKLSIR